jgi:Sulfotransferase family
MPDPLPEILRDLVVTHRRKTPLFVVGHARSGTSVTGAMIRKYLKINFGPESQFIVRYFKRLSRYGALHDDRNLRLLVEDIAGERCFSRWRKRFGFSLDRERVLADLQERSYRGVLVAIFGQFAAYHGMDRWGDKTPEYNRDLFVVDTLFPDAQYVHVVRDGRDAALSAFKVHFGDKNAYATALDWRRTIDAVRGFAAGLQPGRLLEVRYEDLLGDPSAVFARLITFLDIDDADGRLLEFIDAHIGADLRGDNMLKWKSALPPAQQALFEAVAGDLLAAYGYELVAGGRRPLGLPARLFWSLDNRLRKMSQREYWADNLYKTRVRTRALALPFRRLSRRAPADQMETSRRHG